MGRERKSILIVDDTTSILEGLKPIFQGESFDVETAETGCEAIAKCKSRLFNIMLLDIRLPDMNGIDLLVKTRELQPNAIKIMVTGFPSLDNTMESLNLGAHAYIIKPIDPEKLLKIIEEKRREKEEEDGRTFKNSGSFLYKLADLLYDGNYWTIEKIAHALKVPRASVELAVNFYAEIGVVKYWRTQDIVKMSDKLLKYERLDVNTIIPTSLRAL